jgi:hypothetical protein
MFDYQRVTRDFLGFFRSSEFLASAVMTKAYHPAASNVPPSPPELQLVQPQRLKHVGPNSYRESTCLVAPIEHEEMYGKCVEQLGQIYGN